MYLKWISAYIVSNIDEQLTGIHGHPYDGYVQCDLFYSWRIKYDIKIIITTNNYKAKCHL